MRAALAGSALVAASFAYFAARQAARGDPLEAPFYACVALAAWVLGVAERAGWHRREALASAAAAVALVANHLPGVAAGMAPGWFTGANLLWTVGFVWIAAAHLRATRRSRSGRLRPLGAMLVAAGYAAYLALLLATNPDPGFLAAHAVGLPGAVLWVWAWRGSSA